MAPPPARNQSGDAESTLLANSCALKLVRFYRTQVLKIPEKELVSEFEDGELRFYIKGFLHWVCTTPIPAYYSVDGDRLVPSKEKDYRCIQWVTIEGYIGKYLLHLRRDSTFDDIEDFVGLQWNEKSIEAIPWWKEFKVAYKKKFTQMVSELGSDFVFGIDEPIPLYRDNRHWSEEYSDNDEQPEFYDLLPSIDGNSMVCHMMTKANGSNDLLQHRCWLVTMDVAVGRPGELRCLKLHTMKYFGALQTVVLKWHDLKNRDVSAKPMIHNRLGWNYDWFHAMGCYWAVENGLYRSDSEKEKGWEYGMFPQLLKVQPRGASKKVQTAMRNNLPTGTPEHIAKLITGKSVRYAAVTETYAHGDVSGPQGAARTGHSIGNTGDVYKRKMNPHNGICALRARSGYNNVKGKDVLPRLQAISGVDNRAAVAKFVDALFVINLPEFLPHGNLRPVIHTVTASMLLFHENVIRDCEIDNVVTQHMIKSAGQALITDTRLPGGSPSDILCRWSKDIREDLDKRIFDNMKVLPEMHSIATGMNSLLTMTSNLMATDAQRSIENRDLMSKLVVQQSTINHLSRQVEQVSDENVYLKRKLLFIRTPPTESSNKRLAVDSIVEDNTTSNNNDNNESILAPRRIIMPVIVEKPKAITVATTIRNSTAVVNSGIATKLNEVLIALAEDNRLKSDNFSNCTILPTDVREMSRLVHCLEMSMVATTLEERTALVAAPDKVARLDAANKVMKKVAYTLLVYEGSCSVGTEMDKAFRDNAKKEHESYDTMGKRILNLKKKIVERKGGDAGDKNAVRKCKLVILENVKQIQSSMDGFMKKNITT